MDANGVQALLRFLTKDAKLPLATAMAKVKDLQGNDLGTVESIAKAKLDQVSSFFQDEKEAKSVLNAAKRMSKKRTAGDSNSVSPAKKTKKDPFEVPGSRPAAEVEAELELRLSELPEEVLEHMAFTTNRAPLVLAFAATIVKYTMPEQPPSSQLSLAQAVVSLGSQSKAKAIGLQTSPTAEDDGWGQGQPAVKVMGRNISVLKRWGYEWKRKVKEQSPEDAKPITEVEKTGVGNEESAEKPALWAIDLEQLKNLNGPLTFSNAASSDMAGLPVYSPHAARGYMHRSFDSAPSPDEGSEQKAKKVSSAAAAAEREKNVSCLLKALDLLYASWADTLTKEDLDKRSWSWYVHVRPDVEQGVSGWGQKGVVKLKDILDLRRKK